MTEIKGFTALSDIEMMEVEGGGLLSSLLGPLFGPLFGSILSPNVNVTTIVITKK